MKTLNIFSRHLLNTKVHNDVIFLCSLHCHLSATLQTMRIIVVNLQDNRAVFPIFIPLLCFSFDSHSYKWPFTYQNRTMRKQCAFLQADYSFKHITKIYLITHTPTHTHTRTYTHIYIYNVNYGAMAACCYNTKVNITK